MQFKYASVPHTLIILFMIYHSQSPSYKISLSINLLLNEKSYLSIVIIIRIIAGVDKGGGIHFNSFLF